jgi:hypothetical protein
MSARTATILCAGLGVVSLDVACGGGTTATYEETGVPTDEETSGPVHVSGDVSATAHMGGAGGTLSLSNGARLEVPSGALGEEVDVIFGVGSRTQAFNNLEYEQAVGPTLLVQPAVVLQPGSRAKVSVPFTTLPSGFSAEEVFLGMEIVEDEQRALQMGGVQTRWVHAPASAESGRLVGEIEELTGLRLQFVVSRENQ